MNKFVRTKSQTGSKFSKHLWGCYARDGLYAIVMHLYCGFSMWRHSKPPNSGPHFWSIFYQFEEGWRRQLCMYLDAVFADC